MKDIYEILKTNWGYASFRPSQEEIIRSALSGEDVLALMPTGGGKSLCFQVPALAQEGIAIVVSPLIALIKDQVQNLNSRGIRSLAVHSGMTSQEIDATLDNAIYGDYKFLYLSPERLKSRLFKARVAKMNISYLVVDEAHCISQWGYDFRPDYMDIIKIKDIIGQVPIIAVTATATIAVAKDIMDKLGFAKENIIVSDFARNNLSYVVRYVEDKIGTLMRIINSVEGVGIVYVRKRIKAQELSDLLNANNVKADFYHAGLSTEMRSSKQDDWMKGRVKVIIATNAFGMGIDKSNVRFVVHYDLPESLEAYFQEAGRAGRDGVKSFAVLLSSKDDISNLKRFLPISFPELDYIADIYQNVFKYLGIPYEFGAGQTYKFELFPFAKKFHLQQAKAYYAIKCIEHEGYWTLTDAIDNPTRISFIINRDGLYKIQLNDMSMDSFIKTILRLYSGLFSQLIKIDEAYIAKVYCSSVQAVKSKLLELSRLKVIKYIPRNSSPLIVLNNERLVESNFYINKERYNFLKDSYTKRLDSILEYVNNTQDCRAMQLIKYFGQEAKECGCCDICLSNKVKNNPMEVQDAIKKTLLEADGLAKISELQLELEGKYPNLVEVIREMAKVGEVEILDNDSIMLMHNY